MDQRINKQQVFIIGDVHTAAAFSITGLTGIVATPDSVAGEIDTICTANSDSIILLTTDLSRHIKDKITDINISDLLPIIVEIPGIDNQEQFGKSVLSYISEAIGLSI